MKIEATIVLPVKVSIEMPGPLDGLQDINTKDLPEIWKSWRTKVIRRLFSEAELAFRHSSRLAKISTCSLTELEGEVNICPEDFKSSPDDDLPPTVKVTG